MSRIADEIREYVKDPQSTGIFEYGAWGILRKDQRAKIRELCDMCDMFEQTADDFGKELIFYKRALELACEKYINVDGISYVLRDNEDYFDKSDEQIQKETIDYFVSQAKKEWENKFKEWENEFKEWQKNRYNAS